jgi:hypothetical protein
MACWAEMDQERTAAALERFFFSEVQKIKKIEKYKDKIRRERGKRFRKIQNSSKQHCKLVCCFGIIFKDLQII